MNYSKLTDIKNGKEAAKLLYIFMILCLLNFFCFFFSFLFLFFLFLDVIQLVAYFLGEEKFKFRFSVFIFDQLFEQFWFMNEKWKKIKKNHSNKWNIIQKKHHTSWNDCIFYNLCTFYKLSSCGRYLFVCSAAIGWKRRWRRL